MGHADSGRCRLAGDGVGAENTIQMAGLTQASTKQASFQFDNHAVLKRHPAIEQAGQIVVMGGNHG